MILSEIDKKGRKDKTILTNKNENDKIVEENKTRKRVVIYARVSSPKQKDDLERQIELLKESVEKNKEQLIKIYKDIGSGMNDKRKGLQRMIKDCLKKPKRIDNVLIMFGDKLTRFRMNDL